MHIEFDRYAPETVAHLLPDSVTPIPPTLLSGF